MRNPYKGRAKRMVPITQKEGGGAVLRQSGKGQGPGHADVPRGHYDVTDSYLRGTGNPFSSAHVPSKKGR